MDAEAREGRILDDVDDAMEVTRSESLANPNVTLVCFGFDDQDQAWTRFQVVEGEREDQSHVSSVLVADCSLMIDR